MWSDTYPPIRVWEHGKAYQCLHSMVVEYAINPPVLGKQSGYCHSQSSVSDMQVNLWRVIDTQVLAQLVLVVGRADLA